MYYINDSALFLSIGILFAVMLLLMVAIDFEESAKKLTKAQATVILFVVLVSLFGVAVIIKNNIKRNSKIVEKFTSEEVTSTEPTTYQTTIINGTKYELVQKE